MAVILNVKTGPLTGRQIPVPEGQPLTVGRSERANLVVPGDTQISSVHFAVELDGKVCRVVDRRSTNGTTLNGSRITDAMVREGDTIGAGNTLFLVRFVADAPQPAAGASAAGQPGAGAPPVPTTAGVRGAVAPAVAGALASAETATRWPPLPGAGAPVFPPQALAGMRVPGGPAVPTASLPAVPGVPGVPSVTPPAVPTAALPTLGAPQIPPVVPPLPGMPNVALPQVPGMPQIPAVPRPTPPKPSAAMLAAIAAQAAKIKPPVWQASLEVGGWKFTKIPKDWGVPEDRAGIAYALKDVFPSLITAAEEPLPPGMTLQKVFDEQIKALGENLPAPHITELKVPAILGAQSALGADIVYRLENGMVAVLRRVYAESNGVAGVVMLLTLAEVTPLIARDIEAIEAGLRFEAKPPAPPAGANSSTGIPGPSAQGAGEPGPAVRP